MEKALLEWAKTAERFLAKASELGDEKHRVSHRSEALARLQEALEEHAPRLCDADRQERNR